MARGKSKPKCGACKEEVTDNDEALLCDGNCDKWFHIKCVNVSKINYQHINEMSDIILWTCGSCKEVVKTKGKKAAGKSNNAAGDVCCDCFNYIQILTDQISELSVNYRNMSENVVNVQNTTSVLMEDMFMLKSYMEKEPVNNENTSKVTYSEVLKINKTNLSKKNYLHSTKDNELRKSALIRQDPTNTVADNAPYKEQSSRSGDHYLRKSVNDADMGSELNGTVNNSDEETELQLVTKRKKSISNSSKIAATQKQKRTSTQLVVGSANNNSKLSAAEKQSWIYVTRLDPSVTVTDIKSHVGELFNGTRTNIVCEKLPTRHSSYNSFKIGISKDLESACMKDSNWPAGILIGKYFPPRWSQDSINKVGLESGRKVSSGNVNEPMHSKNEEKK